MENMRLYGEDNKSEVNIMLDNELENYFPGSVKWRSLVNEHRFEYWTHKHSRQVLWHTSLRSEASTVHEAWCDVQYYLISSFKINFLATNSILKGQWPKNRNLKAVAILWASDLLSHSASWLWSEYNRVSCCYGDEGCCGNEIRCLSVVPNTYKADTAQLLLQSFEDGK